MKQHPLTGENICKPLKSLRLVLPIIRFHHEHSDGSGYPDGLTEKRNPAPAPNSASGRRLRRPAHHPSLQTGAQSHEQAAHTMRVEAQSGLWDEELVSQFFAMLERRQVA